MDNYLSITSQRTTGIAQLYIDSVKPRWNKIHVDTEWLNYKLFSYSTFWCSGLSVVLLTILQVPHEKGSKRHKKKQKRLVFKSPVSRLEKDCNWTRPRPEKTGPAVRSFHFWDLKTAKRPVFMDRFYRLRPVFCSPIFTLQNAPKNIIFGPKIKKIWLKL